MTNRKGFFEILSPIFKSIIVGTIYRPSNESIFLEVLNENMNKIDSISNVLESISNVSQDLKDK